MLITDVKKILRGKIRDKGLNDVDIANTMGMSRQQFSYMMCHTAWVSRVLIKMCDILGYDVSVSLVKRSAWDEHKAKAQEQEKEISMSEAAQTKLEQPLFKDINTKEEIDQFIAEIMKNAKL